MDGLITFLQQPTTLTVASVLCVLGFAIAALAYRRLRILQRSEGGPAPIRLLLALYGGYLLGGFAIVAIGLSFQS